MEDNIPEDRGTWEDNIQNDGHGKTVPEDLGTQEGRVPHMCLWSTDLGDCVQQEQLVEFLTNQSASTSLEVSLHSECLRHPSLFHTPINHTLYSKEEHF